MYPVDSCGMCRFCGHTYLRKMYCMDVYICGLYLWTVFVDCISSGKCIQWAVIYEHVFLRGNVMPMCEHVYAGSCFGHLYVYLQICGHVYFRDICACEGYYIYYDYCCFSLQEDNQGIVYLVVEVNE